MPEKRMRGNGQEKEVHIPVGNIYLQGTLRLPDRAEGIVVFAHGSGSSRFSRRNQFVALELNKHRHATLLFDLLTREEELLEADTRHLRFDIGLLSGRLVAITDWVTDYPATKNLNIGLFGASTGAAAALVAAADRPEGVHAVVSRGGRPDLAAPALRRVKAPTLLIVGGEDGSVIPLNQFALEQMTCEKNIEIVPGATHLFEEPGALEAVSRLAVHWFDIYLRETKQNTQRRA